MIVILGLCFLLIDWLSFGGGLFEIGRQNFERSWTRGWGS